MRYRRRGEDEESPRADPLRLTMIPATVTSSLVVPRLRDERIFFIRHAVRGDFTIEESFNLTKIDRWFLVQIKEIVDFEEALAGAKN